MTDDDDSERPGSSRRVGRLMWGLLAFIATLALCVIAAMSVLLVLEEKKQTRWDLEQTCFQRGQAINDFFTAPGLLLGDRGTNEEYREEAFERSAGALAVCSEDGLPELDWDDDRLGG